MNKTIALFKQPEFSDAVNENFFPQLIIGDVGLISNKMLGIWKARVGEPSEIIAMSEDIEDAELCLSTKHVSTFYLKTTPVRNLAYLINRALRILVYTNKATLKKRLTFIAGTEMVRIILSEVLYVEDMGQRVEIVTSARTYSTYESFSVISEQLRGYTFLRVSPSLIINVFEVDTVNSAFLKIRDKEVMISESYLSKVARVFQALFDIDLLSI